MTIYKMRFSDGAPYDAYEFSYLFETYEEAYNAALDEIAHEDASDYYPYEIIIMRCDITNHTSELLDRFIYGEGWEHGLDVYDDSRCIYKDYTNEEIDNVAILEQMDDRNEQFVEELQGYKEFSENTLRDYLWERANTIYVVLRDCNPTDEQIKFFEAKMDCIKHTLIEHGLRGVR